MASVRHADLVYVLHEGRFVESGTPEELLAIGGHYRSLHDLQAAQFQPVPMPRGNGTRPEGAGGEDARSISREV